MSESEQRGQRGLSYGIPAMGNAIPHPGDVVVHRQVHSPAVYALSRLKAPLQRSYKTYEEAVALAIVFAQKEHVDGWFTMDQRIYERLAGRPA
jgi:hypothetical protein